MQIEITKPQQDFIDGFIEAFYFADTGEESQPPTDAELSKPARQRITIDCLAFLYRMQCYLEADTVTADMQQAGHDFYFTRQGHGVGYWETDRGYGPYSDMLDAAAKAFPELDFYLSDDNEIEL